MGKRLLRASALAPVMVLMVASAAWALNQTNGTGITHAGSTAGFAAKESLNGHFNYVTHDGTGLNVSCFDYDRYANQPPNNKGALRAHWTATCIDNDGKTIYVQVYAVDAGEPGTKDKLRIFMTYDPNFSNQPDSDPAARATVCNTGHGAPCNDHGIIQNGNVQIHQDDPTTLDKIVFQSA
jgi:hypothetical protein